jgi:hypothetical protein
MRPGCTPFVAKHAQEEEMLKGCISGRAGIGGYTGDGKTCYTMLAVIAYRNTELLTA